MMSDRQVGRQVDRKADRHIGRQTGRQPYRETGRFTQPESEIDSLEQNVLLGSTGPALRADSLSWEIS